MTDTIQVMPRPSCPLCGSSGERLYCELQDRLFGVPGVWSLVRCRDPGCGLLWLDPEPLEAEIHKAYKNYYTHSEEIKRKSLIRKLRSFGLLALHKASIIAGGLSKQHRDVEGMHLSGIHPGRLLDIGCGSGAFLHKMMMKGWSVEGLDFDEAAILKVNQTYGVNARAGRLEDMAYANDIFDAITMHHVIEHMFDTVGTLREIRRILKPGGQLIAVTPNINSWGHKRFQQHWRGLEPPRHVRLFNPRALANAATEAGYQHVRVYSTSANAWSIYAASIALESAAKKGVRTIPATPFAILRALAMQPIEAWINLVSGGIGEECVLVAQK